MSTFSSTDVKFVLDGLGQLEADAIAQLLKDQGIKGVRVLSDHCPVANFVREETSVDISISDSRFETWEDSSWKVAGDTPDNVGQFIRKFDTGEYPFLEA